MTTLEIILIVVIWIVYGVFNAYQDEKSYEISHYFYHIIFCPLVLLFRVLIGIFHSKSINK
jgi:hypothetical protein